MIRRGLAASSLLSGLLLKARPERTPDDPFCTGAYVDSCSGPWHDPAVGTPTFLSLLTDVTDLPSEFVIFRAGENASTKGSVLFDARSAELVMGQASRHGVDYMIDLEHYSVQPRRLDPQSTDPDARGWFRLEMRGGDLWAANVTWTPDGAERLRSRRQRYTSPAFYTREWDDAAQLDRVTNLINVALCAMPATYQLDALVASVQALDGRRPAGYAPARMSDTVPAVASEPVVESPAEQPPVEVAVPAVAVVIVPAPDAEAEDAGPAPEAEPTDAEFVELKSQLLTLSGASSLPEAVRVLCRRVFSSTGRSSAVDAVSFLTSALTERATTLAADRRGLIVELIALGAETPATAWANNAPVDRLASEGLESLRTRIAALRSARPAGSAPPIPPPLASEGLNDVETRALENVPEALRPKFIALRAKRRGAQRPA